MLSLPSIPFLTRANSLHYYNHHHHHHRISWDFDTLSAAFFLLLFVGGASGAWVYVFKGMVEDQERYQMNERNKAVVTQDLVATQTSNPSLKPVNDPGAVRRRESFARTAQAFTRGDSILNKGAGRVIGGAGHAVGTIGGGAGHAIGAIGGGAGHAIGAIGGGAGRLVDGSVGRVIGPDRIRLTRHRRGKDSGLGGSMGSMNSMTSLGTEFSETGLSVGDSYLDGVKTVNGVGEPIDILENGERHEKRGGLGWIRRKLHV